MQQGPSSRAKGKRVHAFTEARPAFTHVPAGSLTALLALAPAPSGPLKPLVSLREVSGSRKETRYASRGHGGRRLLLIRPILV